MDRIAEMKRLRFQELLTTTKIGEMHGISRERVRQLIGNTGRGFVTARRKRIWEQNKDSTNTELRDALGLKSKTSLHRYRGDEWHKADGGNLVVFHEAQKFVSNILRLKGFENKMMKPKSKFSILLENGYKIQIIATNPVQIPRCYATTYSFNTRAELVGIRCDFYICVCLDTWDIFVVPSDKVRGTGTPIRFSFPPTRHYRSKWLQYHNKFDLLEK